MAFQPFWGSPTVGRRACNCLLSFWTPHAIHLCSPCTHLHKTWIMDVFHSTLFFVRNVFPSFFEQVFENITPGPYIMGVWRVWYGIVFGRDRDQKTRNKRLGANSCEFDNPTLHPAAGQQSEHTIVSYFKDPFWNPHKIRLFISRSNSRFHFSCWKITLLIKSNWKHQLCHKGGQPPGGQ